MKPMELAEAVRGARRILVIRRKALGDALVTLPAVLQLVRSAPGAVVDLVVDRPFAPLLERVDSRVRVVSWPPPEGRGLFAWTAWLRARNYDIAIDFLGSPRTALWTVLSGAPLRVGYDLGPRSAAYNVRVPRNRGHGRDLGQFAGESFLDPLRAMGIAADPWRPAGDLRPEAAELDREYVRWIESWFDSPQPRIGIMLSATWPAKAWPAARAAELTRALRRAGTRPLLIPGPGDQRICAETLAEDPHLEVAPPTGLLELADLLGRMDLWVGTDCGARHLARAVGIPTATLFGPTDPLGWNPEDPRHVAVRTGEACSPCDLTTCPVPGHPCLDGLDGGLVAAAALELLAKVQAEPEPSSTRARTRRS